MAAIGDTNRLSAARLENPLLRESDRVLGPGQVVYVRAQQEQLLYFEKDLRINPMDEATTGGLPLQNTISGYFA